MMKDAENAIEGTRLCYVSALHFDVKMLFFHFLTFQQTE